MIIKCPSCSAQFLVPTSAIGASGRTVRCSACGNQWFQDPPSPPPPLEGDRTAPRDAPPTLAEPQEAPEGPEVGDFEAMMAQERRRPPHINLPAVPAAPARRRGVMIGWLVLLLVVGGLSAGVVLGRDRIVTFWPPAVKAYDLVGLDVLDAAIREIPPGLSFLEPPVLSLEREADRDVLTIEVMVVNDGAAAQRLPPLEMWLRDGAGETVDRWVYDTGWPLIAPGETVVVVTRRAEPPPAAASFHMEPAAIPRGQRPPDGADGLEEMDGAARDAMPTVEAPGNGQEADGHGTGDHDTDG